MKRNSYKIVEKIFLAQHIFDNVKKNNKNYTYNWNYSYHSTKTFVMLIV